MMFCNVHHSSSPVTKSSRFNDAAAESVFNKNILPLNIVRENFVFPDKAINHGLGY